ncbi:MAG: DUF1489 domain-containing protein [Pseudomonadota bacterium]
MADHASLNLLKLCVGAERVEDLETWRDTLRRRRSAQGLDARHVHVTRMWPRRDAELLRGGSLYWVFKGLVLARQRILALEPRQGDDGVTRCAIVLDDEVVRTEAQPRRPFQGWRYLAAKDAPQDVSTGDPILDLPGNLRRALSELGVK